ncbi:MULTISPECIES: VOC family protein [Actinosynnema]|uniref:Bleomycin resistance protein n=1 Tax=Actinosynnema pretiosum TaxID=42197 RepID=A0A290Z3M7_9PSEU|nr:VOC family protein [Actinosynnema pretiosum]ATE53585.1 bleomycin resistance protein [Actinosynnema pretiosum]
MTVNVTPHLNFRGDARAALEFYREVFGGHLVAVTYADAHAAETPEQADQVMWGQVTSPEGFAVMAYDVPPSREWDAGAAPFFVSVRGDDEAELTTRWKALSEGAQVLAPLAPSAWAPLYGMLKDRFGVTWVLDIAAPYQG